MQKRIKGGTEGKTRAFLFCRDGCDHDDSFACHDSIKRCDLTQEEDSMLVLSCIEIDLNQDNTGEDVIAAQVFACDDWTRVLLDQGLVECWGDKEKNQACCGGVIGPVAEPTENKNGTDLDKVEHSHGLVSNSKDKGDVQHDVDFLNLEVDVAYDDCKDNG